jgi:hypothetical protein
MAQAGIELTTRSTGSDLRLIADELRAMDDAKVTRLFRDHLDAAAAKIVPRVRASALAIPVKGKKVTGLRGRIAEAVESKTGTQGRQAWGSVYVNVGRMPAGEMSLPLYMEGAKPRWRHPVYGKRKDPNDWVRQSAHPYFYVVAREFGPAAGEELRRALEDITRQLGGR